MKKYIINITYTFMAVLLVLNNSSCKKFLDEKPDKRLVVPSTLTDLQAMLDYSNVMQVNEPYSAEASADNFYLTTANWQSLPETDRAMYTWERDHIYVEIFNDWYYLYNKVYYANVVLDALPKIERNTSNSTDWDNVKGQALMIRGKCFMNALWLWSAAYDGTTASNDPGIPLRLSSDQTEISVRASVKDSYDQVIKDFTEAARLLPSRPLHPIRASKVSAYGYLARTFLSMRDYAHAGLYADSSLQINNSLINYNTLNASANFPISAYNTEVNYAVTYFNSFVDISYAKVDTGLYAMYANNDCRKTVFFKTNTDGSYGFKGTYTGGSGGMAGITSDEMYLTRAECFARGGNKASALADLNSLLQLRMKPPFAPITANTADEALAIILRERRKELLFRGLRWMDLKRLNKEGANILLKRVVNNQTYILQPNDLRYALAIPEYVINITGMQQNPR